MSDVRSATMKTLRPEAWKIWLALCLWGVALYGTLLLGRLRTNWSDAFCGPWGCSAPLEAVLACHLGWLVLLTPGIVWAVRSLGPRPLAYVGAGLVAFGGVGLFAVLASSMARVLDAPRWEAWHVAPSMLQAVWGCVDLPLTEAMALGTLCLTTAWQRRRTRELNHGDQRIRVIQGHAS